MDDRISPQAGWRIAPISELDTKTAPAPPAKPVGPRRGRGAHDSGAPLRACRRCGWQTSSNRIQALPESSVVLLVPRDLFVAAGPIGGQSTMRQKRRPLPATPTPT